MSQLLRPVAFWQQGMIDPKLLAHVQPPPKGLSPSLQRLLQLSGYRHKAGDLEQVVAYTQQRWLRPKGTERWQIADFMLPAASRSEADELLTALCLYDDILPVNKRARYALVAGATARAMRDRFAFLIQLWSQKKVRFEQLVFLVSDRPVDADYETRELILGRYPHKLPLRADWQPPSVLPASEIDEARLIYAQARLPRDLAAVPVVFVSAPMKRDEGGKPLRPNTDDTYAAWLATEPAPGSLFLVSQNPFCGYQDAAARAILSPRFKLETIGPGRAWLGQTFKHAIVFDALGRWVYQLPKIHSKPSLVK